MRSSSESLAAPSAYARAWELSSAGMIPSRRAVRANASRAAGAGFAPLTMPALTVTVADMVAALDRVAGPQVTGLIDWVPDPAVAGMVANWPARIGASRATRLGLHPDPDCDTVIRMYQAGT